MDHLRTTGKTVFFSDKKERMTIVSCRAAKKIIQKSRRGEWSRNVIEVLDHIQVGPFFIVGFCCAVDFPYILLVDKTTWIKRLHHYDLKYCTKTRKHNDY